MKQCLTKDCTVPARNTLCEGAKVMLFTNFLVECDLVNGTIGDVVSLHFSTEEGPKDEEPTGYVI